MKIARAELLKVLKLAQPALATKELVFEALHFWFTGESVIAYNDTIGIEIPCKTDFQGGLLGKFLLAVLEKSMAKDVEIGAGEYESEMILRAGTARVKFALLDPDRAIWQFPKYKEKDAFDVNKEFLELLSETLPCIGQNVSVPDQLGVTFSPYEGDGEYYLDLFTTDSNAIAWARLEVPKNYEADRCCIAEEFCRQLIALAGTRPAKMIVYDDDCALALLDGGIKLYGRIVDIDRPLNFEEIIDEVIPDVDKMITLPSRFKMAIERVSTVIEHTPGAPARVSIDEKGMRLFAKDDARGEIRDSLKIEGEHEEVSAWFDPALIKRAVDKRTQFCVTDDSLIFRGPDNYYQTISAVDRRD